MATSSFLRLDTLALTGKSITDNSRQDRPTATTATQEQNDEDNLHLLNRISFGPTAQDLDTLNREGREGYIRRQLNPERIAESPDVAAYVHSCDALNLSPLDLFRNFGPPAIMAKSQSNLNGSGNAGIDPKQQAKMEARKELFGDIAQQAITARLLRELESPRQFQEIMTDFWFNHFNVSIDKGLVHVWVGAYEEQAIRPYALGKFRDLLEATSHHPAMLFYLDNWENSAPGSPGARGNFTGINENYARELMELHSLGVDGGYTQKDVTELARILTGLGIPRERPGAGQQHPVRPGFRRGPAGLARFGARYLRQAGAPHLQDFAAGLRIGKYGSVFDQDRHDFGSKIFLGQVIQGSGEDEIEQALDILARHPSTAHHISYELAQYFVSDAPPATLVDKLAATFTKTNGDIKAVMNELLHSSEFWDRRQYSCKYKNPLRYAVATLRAADAHPDSLRPVQAFLNQQGMRMYGCLTPDGYKNTKDAWLNSGALLQRLNFATAVGTGHLPGSNNPQPVDYNLLAGEFNGLCFSDQTTRTIAAAQPAIKSTLLLGSPEFMWY